MVKKCFKKVTAMLLVVMMLMATFTVMPVEAKTLSLPEFDTEKTYAIISTTTNKAVQVREVTWSDAGAVYVDGDVVNSKAKDKVAFKITNQGDSQYAFASVGNNGALLKCENTLGNGISFVFNYDTNVSNDHKFTIEPVENGYKLKSYSGVYLGLGENGRLDKVAADQAEVFVFEEVSVIDEYVSIQNVETNKLVSFNGQENLQPVKVTGDINNITDDEKFMPAYTTNDNYIMEDVSGAIDTVAFKSKSKPNMTIISANWVDGAVSDIVAKEANPGGWESIVVEPAGNGQVYLRSSYTHEYITVNENEELALCDKTAASLTDREKFVIHSEVFPEMITDLKIDSSTRTQTTLDLSWTNPVCIYTQIELYQKGPSDEFYSKIADLTNESSYTVTGLNPGNEYSYKLLVINGDKSVSTYSNEVSAKTRVGDKPATPTNVKLDEIGNNKVKISWDKAENATHYKLQWAPSAYGTYTDVENGLVKDGTSIEVALTGNKYENYYRVVAINNGNNDQIGDEAEYSDVSRFVSLETNLFGDHTIIFAQTDDTAQIDSILLALFEQQHDANADAQFKADQYQVYFKPGDYTETSCMYLGFYTSFNGLGKTPYDVKLNNVAIPAYLTDNNATCNFWRSMENVSIINTGNEQGKAQYGSWRADEFNWAVAQAAPLRRVYSSRNISYDWNYGWASGGYVADSYFEGDAGTHSGQQFYTRNSVINGNAFGTTLNNFYQGVISDNLPNEDTGNSLVNGNGYSNWNIGDASGNQQVFTNIETTPKISEKPFLYIDDNGEYQVFVPAVRENTNGVSWSEDDMGEGKSIPLSEFYIATPDDLAATINEQIAAGKNIYFTPGIYYAQEPILVNEDNTILLGTGMASIIPANEEAAMIIDDDVTGVKVAGLIFDAGEHSKYLLKVGTEKNSNNNEDNPIVLQDLFFRVGGTTDTLTKADNALEINANNVLCDHFWIWRADHGAGVEWYGNESDHGLIVNGDNVTCYALFNEHFQKYNTLWNGENGATYFYQNETAYDPISQEEWMSHNGTVNGYSSYKVANNVKSHYAVGLGIYNVFIYTGEDYDSSKVQIQLDNAIEVPNSENVLVENACLQTFAKDDGALQRINTIINGVGDGVSSGKDNETGLTGEGWSRKFLISYQNGTAVVGKATDGSDEQKGKYLGVETITNVRQFGEDGLDAASMQALYDQYKDLTQGNYTEGSWNEFSAALQEVERVLSKDYLKYEASNSEFNEVLNNFKTAIENLQVAGDKTKLQEIYDNYQILKEANYTKDSWKAFASAMEEAKKVLNDSEALQEDIDKAYQALTDAYNKLVLISDDTNTGDNENQDQNSDTVKTPAKHDTKKAVKTGDDSLVTLFATTALLSSVAFTCVKRKHED